MGFHLLILESVAGDNGMGTDERLGESIRRPLNASRMLRRSVFWVSASGYMSRCEEDMVLIEEKMVLYIGLQRCGLSSGSGTHECGLNFLIEVPHPHREFLIAPPIFAVGTRYVVIITLFLNYTTCYG